MPRFYILIATTMLLVSCARKEADHTNASSSGVDPTSTIQHAQHFSVTNFKTYKIVKTHASITRWGSNETQTLQDVMVLYQRGTEPPALVGELQDATLIQVPVDRVATNLESTERFLEEFGAHHRIQAVGGLISYNDSIRQMVLQGKIGQIGYSWHQSPNQEVLLERKIDLFLMTISNLDFKDGLEKCRQLGIPTATVFDWAESTYLAQAEWIKYFALFFNEEAAADKLFNEIVANVESLKKKVSALPEKPTVMWGYYTGKGRWLIHRNSAEAQLLKDAGADNVFYDSMRAIRNEGEPFSTEQLITGGKDVTHWIIGDIHSAELPGENIMSTFNAWRTGKLYHNMKRSKPEANAYDWYGSAPVRPDYVLADLVKLLHPQITLDHELMFMDRFDKRFKFPVDDGNF
ncbi:MAG: ABC transporter substrate-binding protein [Flammeovirgaceae bacterium]